MYAKRMSELREFCFLGVSGETGLPAPNSRYGLCGRKTNVRRRSSFHLILFCMAVCAATCLPRSSTQRVYDDLYMARAL